MSHAPNRLTLAAAAQHVIEHEAATATGTTRMHVHWERDWPLLDKLMDAARAGRLKVYRRGEFQSADPGKLPPTTELMHMDVFTQDVDVWLDVHESRTPFRFQVSQASVASVRELNPTAARIVHSTKGERADALTDEIEQAVRKTGSTRTATVFTELTERALAEHGPFKGVTEDGALMYMGNGTMKTVTPKSLGQRLKRLAKAR